MAWKRSKKGKIQFPVAVRGSKTSVLKFPNDEQRRIYACDICVLMLNTKQEGGREGGGGRAVVTLMSDWDSKDVNVAEVKLSGKKLKQSQVSPSLVGQDCRKLLKKPLYLPL